MTNPTCSITITLYYSVVALIFFGLWIRPTAEFEIHAAKVRNLVPASQLPCVLQTQFDFAKVNEIGTLAFLKLSKTMKFVTFKPNFNI